jgi:hypothetical protein
VGADGAAAEGGVGRVFGEIDGRGSVLVGIERDGVREDATALDRRIGEVFGIEAVNEMAGVFPGSVRRAPLGGRWSAVASSFFGRSWTQVAWCLVRSGEGDDRGWLILGSDASRVAEAAGSIGDATGREPSGGGADWGGSVRGRELAGMLRDTGAGRALGGTLGWLGRIERMVWRVRRLPFDGGAVLTVEDAEIEFAVSGGEGEAGEAAGGEEAR